MLRNGHPVIPGVTRPSDFVPQPLRYPQGHLLDHLVVFSAPTIPGVSSREDTQQPHLAAILVRIQVLANNETRFFIMMKPSGQSLGWTKRTLKYPVFCSHILAESNWIEQS